jgi:N-acylneuraminate cytidylyltransferase
VRIAIIPARARSKRIYRKNIRDFAGKPIIAYPIATAISSGLFDHVIVSTDDDEIAETAERYGAQVPFRRPLALGDDHTSTDSVLIHALGECRRLFGAVQQGCCIYPANPFLDAGDLHRGLDLLASHQATSAFPLIRYDFPIEQAFVLEGVRPRPRWPEQIMARSQDLIEHFHDAGSFYWCDVEKFLRAGRLFTEDAAAFVIPSERCQDINTLEDWARAEDKYRLLSSPERA